MAAANRTEILDRAPASKSEGKLDKPLDYSTAKINEQDSNEQAKTNKELLTTTSKKLEQDNILPPGDILLAGLPSNLSQSDRRLMSNLDSVYGVVGKEYRVNDEGKQIKLQPVSEAECLVILILCRDEKKLFQATLGELSSLQAGKVSPATYMFDVMRKAAEIGGNDNDKFVKLISMPFSGPSYKDTERAILGTSYNPAGAVLERAYEHLVRGRASSAYSGFNPNIADKNSDSTVTHHYREFLLLGYQKGQGVGNIANENGDDTVEGNPGDLRSGYFGSMIGAGLRNKEITPQEAINITEWAYKLHRGTPPLWDNVAFKFGTRERSEALGDYYLDTRQYDLSDWKRAYNQRNR